MTTLSISIVTYHSDLALFKSTCASLFVAIEHARQRAGLRSVALILIDNTEDSSDTKALYGRIVDATVPTTVLSGHGNVGYGAGHNLAMHKTNADFHLVLNPDVTLRRDALTNAISLCAVRQDVVCISPAGTAPDGTFTSMAKRSVSAKVLLLRAFAPSGIKARYQSLLDAYEYRGELGDASQPVVTVSGAFMFLRTAALKKIGGFDERFFLHFEDVDLSLRLHRVGALLYAPEVRVVHAGGGAARKHARFMVANGWRYFRKWGLGDPMRKVERRSRPRP